jgi:HEAT repeat protein
MAKPSSIEQQLNELAACRSDPSSPGSRDRLTAALKSKSTLVVDKAATIILAANLIDCLPAMVEAFDRVFTAGDKGCVALTPLANALYTFGHTDPAPFLRGIRHFQPGGSPLHPTDAAAELRGLSALGLARLGCPDLLLEMADLLNDRMPPTRQMAARAIAYAGHDAGALLLRMKVLAGDRDAEVVAECFTALMKVAPKKSLPFVARFLQSEDPAVIESAAMAIGGSRLPEAFALLKDEWEGQLESAPRRPLLLAIAMTRQPAAIEFLLERIADDRPAPAADAVAAMAIYKHDDAVKTRISALVTTSASAVVTAAFQKAFA